MINVPRAGVPALENIIIIMTHAPLFHAQVYCRHHYMNEGFQCGGAQQPWQPEHVAWSTFTIDSSVAVPIAGGYYKSR